MNSKLLEEYENRFAGKGTWVLKCPAVPPSGNITKRMHWTAYAHLMEMWYLLIRSSDGFLTVTLPSGKRFVNIIRYSKRSLDRDNLYTSVKPVVDALKPSLKQSGVYKSGKKVGQTWTRQRVGHGLIVEDNDSSLELKVINGTLPKRTKPYTLIVISDFPIIEG
jgi:hypothetical protein